LCPRTFKAGLFFTFSLSQSGCDLDLARAALQAPRAGPDQPDDWNRYIMDQVYHKAIADEN
jgi:hypothetical protein